MDAEGVGETVGCESSRDQRFSVLVDGSAGVSGSEPCEVGMVERVAADLVPGGCELVELRPTEMPRSADRQAVDVERSADPAFEEDR